MPCHLTNCGLCAEPLPPPDPPPDPALVFANAAAPDAHLLTVRGMTRSDAELARDPVWLGLVEQARAAGWVR